MSGATGGKGDAPLSLDGLQERFAAALRGGGDSLLAGLGIRAEGADAARRFAVYRNNVYHSLSRALQDAHPVATRLVGEEFFRAVARAWLDAGGLPDHAPLHDYGEGFPAFLESFPPAAQLPWLGDVARVEQAWLRAWHGADAPRAAAPDACLPSVGGEEMARMSLLLHPSLATAALRWPAVAIWQAHQRPDAEARLGEVDVAERQNLAVAVRARHGEVRVFSLAGEAAGFVRRLQAGAPVLDAAQGTGEDAVRESLAALAQAGAVLGTGEAHARRSAGGQASILRQPSRQRRSSGRKRVL